MVGPSWKKRLVCRASTAFHTRWAQLSHAFEICTQLEFMTFKYFRKTRRAGLGKVGARHSAARQSSPREAMTMPNRTGGDVKLATGTERPIERTRQCRPTEGYSCVDYVIFRFCHTENYHQAKTARPSTARTSQMQLHDCRFVISFWHASRSG